MPIRLEQYELPGVGDKPVVLSEFLNVFRSLFPVPVRSSGWQFGPKVAADDACRKNAECNLIQGELEAAPHVQFSAYLKPMHQCEGCTFTVRLRGCVPPTPDSVETRDAKEWRANHAVGTVTCSGGHVADCMYVDLIPAAPVVTARVATARRPRSAAPRAASSAPSTRRRQSTTAAGSSSRRPRRAAATASSPASPAPPTPPRASDLARPRLPPAADVVAAVDRTWARQIEALTEHEVDRLCLNAAKLARKAVLHGKASVGFEGDAHPRAGRYHAVLAKSRDSSSPFTQEEKEAIGRGYEAVLGECMRTFEAAAAAAARGGGGDGDGGESGDGVNTPQRSGRAPPHKVGETKAVKGGRRERSGSGEGRERRDHSLSDEEGGTAVGERNGRGGGRGGAAASGSGSGSGSGGARAASGGGSSSVAAQSSSTRRRVLQPLDGSPLSGSGGGSGSSRSASEGSERGGNVRGRVGRAVDLGEDGEGGREGRGRRGGSISSRSSRGSSSSRSSRGSSSGRSGAEGSLVRRRGSRDGSARSTRSSSSSSGGAGGEGARGGRGGRGRAAVLGGRGGRGGRSGGGGRGMSVDIVESARSESEGRGGGKGGRGGGVTKGKLDGAGVGTAREQETDHGGGVPGGHQREEEEARVGSGAEEPPTKRARGGGDEVGGAVEAKRDRRGGRRVEAMSTQVPSGAASGVWGMGEGSVEGSEAGKGRGESAARGRSRSVSVRGRGGRGRGGGAAGHAPADAAEAVAATQRDVGSDCAVSRGRSRSIPKSKDHGTGASGAVARSRSPSSASSGGRRPAQDRDANGERRGRGGEAELVEKSAPTREASSQRERTASRTPSRASSPRSRGSTASPRRGRAPTTTPPRRVGASSAKESGGADTGRRPSPSSSPFRPLSQLPFSQSQPHDNSAPSSQPPSRSLPSTPPRRGGAKEGSSGKPTGAVVSARALSQCNVDLNAQFRDKAKLQAATDVKSGVLDDALRRLPSSLSGGDVKLIKRTALQLLWHLLQRRYSFTSAKAQKLIVENLRKPKVPSAVREDAEQMVGVVTGLLVAYDAVLPSLWGLSDASVER